MNPLRPAFEAVMNTLNDLAGRTNRPPARLLAVSKGQSIAAIASLAELGQRAFGENYLQECSVKQQALSHLELEWHLIGRLQSNKCRDAAVHFDWVQSLDRAQLIAPLNRYRPSGRAPLNLLIQVNVDNEASKSGCAPAEVPALAQLVAAAPNLRLRGLMGIGAPDPDFAARRASFRQLRQLFMALALEFPGIDTLSMGMSEDYPLAIEEGASMVRVGSRLFGPRNPGAAM